MIMLSDMYNRRGLETDTRCADVYTQVWFPVLRPRSNDACSPEHMYCPDLGLCPLLPPGESVLLKESIGSRPGQGTYKMDLECFHMPASAEEGGDLSTGHEPAQRGSHWPNTESSEHQINNDSYEL